MVPAGKQPCLLSRLLMWLQTGEVGGLWSGPRNTGAFQDGWEWSITRELGSLVPQRLPLGLAGNGAQIVEGWPPFPPWCPLHSRTKHFQSLSTVSPQPRLCRIWHVLCSPEWKLTYVEMCEPSWQAIVSHTVIPFLAIMFRFGKEFQSI